MSSQKGGTTSTLFANKLIEIEGKSAHRFILKEIEAVDNGLKEL